MRTKAINTQIDKQRKRHLTKFKNAVNSSASYLKTVPASLWLISFMFLLIVTAVTFYSIGQVNQLEKATKGLLQAAIPLKDFSNHLNNRMKKTEFFLHKYLVLNDIDYFFAAEDEIQQQKSILANLHTLLSGSPKTLKILRKLQNNLNIYWKETQQLKSHTTNSISSELEQTIEFELIELNSSINQLALNRASTTIKSGEHVTKVLLLLVIGTAVAGLAISLLYGITAIRPIRRIRHALQRIGEGKFDQNLDLEGFQELRDLSLSVNNMQTKLIKLEKAKSEFLSMISHELKTPLASFQTGICLLLSGGAGELSEKQNKVIKIIQKQTVLLSTSIQEMLDMQSIQAQRMVMDIRPSNLLGIINDAIDQISPLTAEKKQHIEWRPTKNNITVLVDPERTRQILLNLLSNANKYSPSKTQITITVLYSEKYAELIVEDEGPGISEEFLDVACDRFFQVPLKGMHQRGTGLGLAIVKEIAESQYGTVKLENCKSKGLRVRIELPLQKTVETSLILQKPTTDVSLENVSL